MSRIDRLARRYAETCAQARAAYQNGDRDAYAWLAREARRLARALAEG